MHTHNVARFIVDGKEPIAFSQSKTINLYGQVFPDTRD